MRMNTSAQQRRKMLFMMTVLFVVSAFFAGPAMAEGVEVVNQRMQAVSIGLKSVSVITIVMAITIVGYQMMYKKAAFSDNYPVVIGGILVAGATGIGGMVIGG